MFSRRYYEAIGLLALRLNDNGIVHKDWEEALGDPIAVALKDGVEKDLEYEMSWSQCDWAINFSKNCYGIASLLEDAYYDINQVV